MPVSRPSRAGAPTRPFPKGHKDRISDELAEEADAVDKKLEQLEAAREKAALAAAARREKKIKDTWDWLRRHFELSRRQEALLRACDGRRPSLIAVIESIYKVRWNRLGRAWRRKYRSRLRTLQHALNSKLRENAGRQRVATEKGHMQLVAARQWKKPRRRSAPRAPKKQQSSVTQCATMLLFLLRKRPLLEPGWLPVKNLEGAARRAGYGPSTVKNARKRLGLRSKHSAGYGERGKWLVALPIAKKTAGATSNRSS